MAMSMKGHVLLPASREVVWERLNDPATLKACIPGCQSLERTGENAFAAVAKVKVGPVNATFKGNVELSDLDPPNGYRISGGGEGGIAGFAKGTARVTLTQSGEGCQLEYDVEANVGGKLAQMGSRLIDSVAKKTADQFFANFAAAVTTASPAVAAAPMAVAAEASPAVAVEPPGGDLAAPGADATAAVASTAPAAPVLVAPAPAAPQQDAEVVSPSVAPFVVAQPQAVEPASVPPAPPAPAPVPDVAAAPAPEVAPAAPPPPEVVQNAGEPTSPAAPDAVAEGTAASPSRWARLWSKQPRTP